MHKVFLFCALILCRLWKVWKTLMMKQTFSTSGDLVSLCNYLHCSSRECSLTICFYIWLAIVDGHITDYSDFVIALLTLCTT
jgi:hypothetical protein